MKRMVYLIALMVAVSSCVSKSKFTIAEKGRMAALSRERALIKHLEQMREKETQLNGIITDLKRDTAYFATLGRSYAEALSANLSEQDQLTALLQQKMSKLAEQEATIRELQQEMNLQREKTAALMGSVKEALLGFSSDELSVTQKNGKVYVAMSDKLLFESGKAQVNRQGREALGKLAEVLKKQTDIDVMIEGHTDSIPIRTSQYKDNWDLSVIRATSVVRILTQDYGVDPLQIVPSGRSEYMPVDRNDTSEGRSRNRRTEIIMAPRLDKLMDILK